MDLWTDYPILELGDKSGELAPVRRCWLKAYDGDKYATVIVGDLLVEEDIKLGYIYKGEGRYGEHPSLTHDEAKRWLAEENSGP